MKKKQIRIAAGSKSKLAFSAVSVGVGNEAVTHESGIVRLGGGHQFLAGDVDDLVVLKVAGRVLQRQKNAPAAPAELVAERVVRALWRGQAAAVGPEALDLAAL
jgi:hypothetical protein